ncbi:hypothetical protein EDB81DRAFT_663540, partial [Dactylonectria macrodidyma]
WAIADAGERNTDDDENDRSPIEVSRASSPPAIRLNYIGNRRGIVHISVSWPIGLPWFQFQDACFNATSAQNIVPSDDQDDKNQDLPRHHTTSVFARQNFSDLESHKGVQEAVSEMSIYMPERYEGENAARLRALVSTDPYTVKMKEVEIFAYKLSNGLIEGVASDQDQYLYESVLDEKYFSIIDMYHEINLPRTAWRRLFNQRLRATSPTGSALMEKLFEAAIMTVQHDIVELLLEAGADPNQPVRNYLTGVLQLPIQFAVQGRGDDLKLLQMLIGFGANPNLISNADTTTALQQAATNCSLKAIVALVEAGADIGVPAGVDESEDESANGSPTVLLRVIETAAWSHNLRCGGQGTATSEEDGALEILAYLVPLYNQATGHEALQSALLAAAAAGQTDMFDLLLSAGARMDEVSWPGYTPLIAATQRCCMCKSVRTVSKLLVLGADSNGLVNNSKKMGISALHIAALRGHDGVVRLLVDRGANINGHAQIAKHTIHLFGDSKRPDGHLLEDIRQCKTPIELALIRYTAPFHRTKKTAAAALTLVRAGAEIVGGEFARAPGLGDTSPLTMSLLQELIGRGADVNELDQAGHSALYHAIVADAVSLVSYLVEMGVVLHGDELRHAVRVGNQEIIEIILQHMGVSRINEDEAQLGEQVSLLETAALSKNWSLMAWLTETHSLPYDPAALCAAIGLGLGTRDQGSQEQDLQHLETLLRARPPNYEDHSPMEATALAFAAFNALTSTKRSHPLLRRLLDIQTFATANAICILPEKETSSWYGGTIATGFTDVNSANVWNEHFWSDPGMARCSLLAPFIALGKWEVVERFLHKGHRPDHISLLMAIRYASLDQTCRLTEHMSLASLSGAWRCRFDTPLQAATRLRRKDVVQHLLHQGVHVNAAPATRKTELFAQITEFVLPRTAFQAAVENGDLDIMELLLEAGADVNAPPADDSGATALQIAAATGQIGIARRLIALGADINADGARAHGRTALEAAAEHGRLDMVHFLLEVGAKILEPTGTEFRRAKSLATRNGHSATARLLKMLRAKQDTGDDVTENGSSDGNYSDDSLDTFATSDEDGGMSSSDEFEGSDFDRSSEGGSENCSREEDVSGSDSSQGE